MMQSSKLGSALVAHHYQSQCTLMQQALSHTDMTVMRSLDLSCQMQLSWYAVARRAGLAEPSF